MNSRPADIPTCCACGELIVGEALWHSTCAETITQEHDETAKQLAAAQAEMRAALVDMRRTIAMQGFRQGDPNALLKIKAWAIADKALRQPSKAAERWEVVDKLIDVWRRRKRDAEKYGYQEMPYDLRDALDALEAEGAANANE